MCLHIFALRVAASRGWAVPGMLTFPNVEIKVVLVLSMGILDTSLSVLASAKSAPFWKMIAVAEVVLILAFTT